MLAASARFAPALSFSPPRASSMNAKPLHIGSQLLGWCGALPAIAVDGDRIFTQDGNGWTSAGVYAGTDLALAMVEEDHGRVLAQQIARASRRDGGQKQFSSQLAATGHHARPLGGTPPHRGRADQARGDILEIS